MVRHAGCLKQSITMAAASKAKRLFLAFLCAKNKPMPQKSKEHRLEHRLKHGYDGLNALSRLGVVARPPVVHAAIR